LIYYLGLIFLLKLSWNLLWVVRTYFLRSPKNLKKYGEWVIITGCTDGIGKAIAVELAKKKMNLILVSRTQQKLDDFKKELLLQNQSLNVKTFAVDFSNNDPENLTELQRGIENLDIGLLVNNVGVSYDYADYFQFISEQKIKDLINVNIYSVINMTNLVLPGMVDRKRGAIVNVSSNSGLVHEPFYAVYAGTKSFVNTFSIALYYEYKRKGVHIQSQLPSVVTSKMSKVRNSSFFIPNESTYAKSLIKQIGYEPSIISHFSHWLEFNVGKHLLPTWALYDFLVKKSLNIRRRGYEKYQRVDPFATQGKKQI